MNNESKELDRFVIIGGGTAGWLTAAILASHIKKIKTQITITLIEPKDIPTIGVGEGSWPTLRETLKCIGISERLFLNECQASFKQGSSFVNWLQDDINHQYYHPFVMPDGYLSNNPILFWQKYYSEKNSFASSFTIQADICDRHLAPKQPKTPEYAAVLNYGYHFDAGKLVNMLREYCTKELGVHLVPDKVIDVSMLNNGDVSMVSTEHHGTIGGDLFLDCSGFHSVIFDDIYNIEKKSVSDVLFNDSAWVAQVPYGLSHTTIESVTKATALSSGWVWDISLQERKGTGYVFSSKHQSDEQALHELKAYHHDVLGVEDTDLLSYRKIEFQSAYRAEFWKNNCIAIGLSAGFVEPLEATAIALVEQNAKFLCDHLPLSPKSIDIIRKRYNRSTTRYWERAVEFIKLHYILSERQGSAYWIDHRKPETCPDGLQDKLTVWQYSPASRHDLVAYDEFFTSASYQYILSGMGFHSDKQNNCSEYEQQCQYHYESVQKKKPEFVKHLPTNIELLNAYKE